MGFWGYLKGFFHAQVVDEHLNPFQPSRINNSKKSEEGFLRSQYLMMQDLVPILRDVYAVRVKIMDPEAPAIFEWVSRKRFEEALELINGLDKAGLKKIIKKELSNLDQSKK